jgi:hypothetical protein
MNSSGSSSVCSSSERTRAVLSSTAHPKVELEWTPDLVDHLHPAQLIPAAAPIACRQAGAAEDNLAGPTSWVLIELAIPSSTSQRTG